MAVDLADAYPEAREVFEKGREVLGRDILGVCRDGPEEELNSTRTSQPAIFLHSMAMLEVLSKRWSLGDHFCRQAPALGTAGLSLGEYSALVFAGSLEFEEALRIVGLRAQFMQEACDREKGSMASVLGLPAEKVEGVVQSARSAGLRVGVANYNSPDQTVISGEARAVDETSKKLEEAGARRVIRLKVAGAYHSELMSSATRQLEPFLKEMTIRKPRIPFYSNVGGAEVGDPEMIRSHLIRQVESPVRWEQTVRALLERGLTGALELGPGRVLQGLLRGIQRSLEVISAGGCADIQREPEKLQGFASSLRP
jgi:[acyl-carrier-protein] S-malonyltransferase